MGHGELNRPVVKLAPAFYDGLFEIEYRGGDVGATSIQQQALSDSRKNLLKLKKLLFVKTQKWSYLKFFFKLGQKVSSSPDFGQ